jgi:hypothetical protein
MVAGCILFLMQKLLIAAAAFVVSATLGVGLLVLGAVLFAVIHIERQHTSGIGAVAGGLNTVTVLLVPLLTGLLGAGYVLRRTSGPRP